MITRGILKKLCFCSLFLLISFLLLNRAARTPFGMDEIVTLRIAQCKIGLEMWQAITAGFDWNPPAISVAVRLTEMAFGRGHISSRLPSIIAGLTVLLC